ncbi:MAG: hypothetical protein ACLFQ8_02690 [Candidatus Aenigmatarchaeota archaeon]
MTEFQRISGKCQIIISREFGYAVLGSFLGILSSLFDFGIGLFRTGEKVLSASGTIGLVFSLLALFVASDYIRNRKFTGSYLLFSSAVIFTSLGILGRPGFFELTQPNIGVRLISFLPMVSTILLVVSGRKFLRKI